MDSLLQSIISAAISGLIGGLLGGFVGARIVVRKVSGQQSTHGAKSPAQIAGRDSLVTMDSHVTTVRRTGGDAESRNGSDSEAPSDGR